MPPGIYRIKLLLIKKSAKGQGFPCTFFNLCIVNNLIGAIITLKGGFIVAVNNVRFTITLPKVVVDYYKEQAKVRMLPYTNYISYLIISRYCKDNKLNIDEVSIT